MYNTVVNPETGRRVSIHGRKGKEILRNYYDQAGAGWFADKFAAGKERARKAMSSAKTAYDKSKTAEVAKTTKEWVTEPMFEPGLSDTKKIIKAPFRTAEKAAAAGIGAAALVTTGVLEGTAGSLQATGRAASKMSPCHLCTISPKKGTAPDVAVTANEINEKYRCTSHMGTSVVSGMSNAAAGVKGKIRTKINEYREKRAAQAEQQAAAAAAAAAAAELNNLTDFIPLSEWYYCYTLKDEKNIISTKNIEGTEDIKTKCEWRHPTDTSNDMRLPKQIKNSANRFPSEWLPIDAKLKVRLSQDPLNIQDYSTKSEKDKILWYGITNAEHQKCIDEALSKCGHIGDEVEPGCVANKNSPEYKKCLETKGNCQKQSPDEKPCNHYIKIPSVSEDEITFDNVFLHKDTQLDYTDHNNINFTEEQMRRKAVATDAIHLVPSARIDADATDAASGRPNWELLAQGEKLLAQHQQQVLRDAENAAGDGQQAIERADRFMQADPQHQSTQQQQHQSTQQQQLQSTKQHPCTDPNKQWYQETDGGPWKRCADRKQSGGNRIRKKSRNNRKRSVKKQRGGRRLSARNAKSQPRKRSMKRNVRKNSRNRRNSRNRNN